MAGLTMAKPIMNALFLSLTIILSRSQITEARKWRDVVDPEVFIITDDDIVRKIHAMEQDPMLARSTDAPTASPTISFEPTISPSKMPTVAPTTLAPSSMPSSSPTISILPTVVPTQLPTQTMEPTIEQSSVPTSPPIDLPTVSPTIRYKNVEGNGGCGDQELLYEIIMYDSWGDGWGGTKLTIERKENPDGSLFHTDMIMKRSTEFFADGTSIITTKTRGVDGLENATDFPAFNESANPIFSGGLEIGKEGFQYVCLRPWRCYSVVADGGQWKEEVKWEIRPVPVGMTDAQREIQQKDIARGGAPRECQFSLRDSFTGKSACESTCTWFPSERPPNVPAPPSPPTVSPPTAPSSEPTAMFAALRADVSSPAPTFYHSSSPSNSPTESPTKAPSKSPTKTPTVAATASPTLAPTVKRSNPPSFVMEVDVLSVVRPANIRDRESRGRDSAVRGNGRER